MNTRAEIAQMAERILGKDEVMGSIPVLGSISPSAHQGDGDDIF